jgi:hypothetical protein
MAARQIRSIVARFVVVTGLAASLLAGSSALVEPREASAANYNCLFMVHYTNKAIAAWDAGKGALGDVYWNVALYYSDRCPSTDPTDPWG